jgi:ABC-type multidrug transport system fused ATPase/permease subunit
MENFSILLIVSSLIFITNSLSAYYKNYFFYSILFFCLTITSVIFHYHTTLYTKIIDKIFILAIVLYGGHLLYKKTNINNQYQVFLIILTFLTSIFLFYYGYCVNEYCYHPDKCISNRYHCMLHILSSLGHHLIIFL